MFLWINKRNIIWLPPLIWSLLDEPPFSPFYRHSYHGAKVLCILRHRAVQLILAYSWARPAILVAGKGRGEMFLFLLFLHFIHVLLSSLSLYFISSTISSISFLPFSGRRHKMTHKGWHVIKPQHNKKLGHRANQRKTMLTLQRFTFLKQSSWILLKMFVLISQIWNWVIWGQTLGHRSKSKEDLVNTPEVTFFKQSSWILFKMFVLMISKSSLLGVKN